MDKQQLEKRIDHLGGKKARLALYFLLYSHRVSASDVERALDVAMQAANSPGNIATQLQNLKEMPIQ